MKPLFDFSKRYYGAYKYCYSLVHSQQQTFKLKKLVLFKWNTVLEMVFDNLEISLKHWNFSQTATTDISFTTFKGDTFNAKNVIRNTQILQNVKQH